MLLIRAQITDACCIVCNCFALQAPPPNALPNQHHCSDKAVVQGSLAELPNIRPEAMHPLLSHAMQDVNMICFDRIV